MDCSSKLQAERKGLEEEEDKDDEEEDDAGFGRGLSDVNPDSSSPRSLRPGIVHRFILERVCSPPSLLYQLIYPSIHPFSLSLSLPLLD